MFSALKKRTASVYFGFRLAAIAMALGGCATFETYTAKHEQIQKATEPHVYAEPLSALWPKVEKAFSGAERTGDHELTTAWTDEDVKGYESMTFKARRIVAGESDASGGCRIHVTLERGYTRAGGSKVHLQSSRRDLDKEWELLRQLDPDAAARIESQAQAYAERKKAEQEKR